MHWAGKHSRKTRGVKLQQNGDDDVPEDDAFAGTLSPAVVQANTTLRAALQLRLVQDLTKVAAELGRPEGPSTRSMERLSMAVRLTRALGAPQLRAVQSQLADQPAKELFRDVLAMCGSVPCVEQTITMIKERKMSSMAAQLALNSLADRVSVPSRIVLKYLQDLYTSSSDEQVKVSAALALGELAGRAARPLAAATASFLADQLSGPSSASLKVPLIFALGRTAAPQAVRTLIAKAKSKEVAPYQRAQSVLALTASALRSPSAVRGALLALLHDPTESAPVRMAAVSLLAYTRPSLPVWQRLAVSTFYEPNLAVASYVWSTIDSFAKMRDPNYGQQTQFARLALPLARRLPQGAHLAFNVVAGSVDAQLDRMVHQHAAYHSHVDAASAYYRRVTRFAGITSLDQEVDLWGANPDELMQAAMQVVFGPQDLKAKASARPATDVPHSTRSIHEKLNIVKRNLQNPQGHLRVTLQPFLKNLFLTFDKDTPTNIANAAKRCMSKLSSEAPFHVQHLGGEEMSVSTVNEMGFPVTLRIQAPWLVRAEGSAQLLNYQSAQANATLLYSAGLIAQLSVQPSWDTREHVAAVSGHAMVHFSAATLRAQVNATAGRVFLQLEPAAERSHSVLARLSAQPMTASVDLSRAELATESVTAHNASRVQGLAMGTAPQPVELSTWSEMSLSLRAPVERPALVGWLRQSRTVLGFPVLGRPLTASRAEMIVSHPHAINANFSLVKGMLQRGDLDVVYPSSLRQDNLVSDIVTSTEKPLATTESSTASTTQQPSANNQPVIVEARSARRAQNGSVFVDDGDVDFSASVFNATTLNPYTNRINGSSELFVLSQVLAGMTAGRGYVVGVNVTTEPAYESSPPYTYSGFWAFGANLGRRLTRAGLFARSDSDNAQMAATAAIFRDIPARADLDKALRQPPSLMIKAEYQQIDATAVKKVITAALETSRTALKDRLLWQSARQQQCIAPDQVKDDNVAVDAGCRELLRTANTPDQFNLTINYNNPAEEAWKNGMHAFFQASRAYLNNKGNVFVDSLTTGNDNELGAGLTVQPDGTLDGWLQTPRTMTKVAAANTWTPASLLAAVNSDSGAYCGLTASRLVTLDGAKGNFELSSCWHLLAKDCSGKSRVAVLARADKPKSKEILVEINVDNYQVAQLSPDGSAVLNGVAVANQTDQAGSAVEVRDANDVSVMTIVRAEDGALSVQLRDHGLSVLYGNNTVIVQVGASLQGRLCGMCGNYGGKASADLLNPQNKVEKTIQSFADSYALDCNTKGLQ